MFSASGSHPLGLLLLGIGRRCLAITYRYRADLPSCGVTMAMSFNIPCVNGEHAGTMSLERVKNALELAVRRRRADSEVEVMHS